MSRLEDLRNDLEKIIDPSLNMTLKESNAIEHLDFKDDVIELRIAIKSRKKDESAIKLEVARIVKIKHSFSGLRVDFVDSKVVIENDKKITFLGIISGKGGVGKSSVTANLAKAFTQLGKVVGVIDADIYGASLPSIFSIPIEPLSTTEDDLIIPAMSEDIQVISPEFFMPENQPLMWRGPMLGKLLTHFFESVAWDPETNLILVDLPPGTGDVQLDIQSFIPDAKMLLVTTPHPNASHVALKAGLGAKEIGHEVIGVVENMSYYYNESSQEKDFIFGQGGGQKVAELLNTDLLAQIPINQPLDKKSYLYNLNDMNGKLYLVLGKKLLNLI